MHLKSTWTIYRFRFPSPPCDLLAGTGLGNGTPVLSRGFIKELTISVPWKSLRSRSVEVRVDAVEVLFVRPRAGSAAAMVVVRVFLVIPARLW